MREIRNAKIGNTLKNVNGTNPVYWTPAVAGRVL